MTLYPLGTSAACHYAARALSRQGIRILDHPAPEITHLLLDAPSFQPDGKLRGGGDLSPILEMLPPQLTIIGGNLQTPLLSDYPKLDLLQLESYLAPNAAITAQCALQVAAEHLDQVFAGLPVLVIGWGRIGKCLARLLRVLDAQVIVSAHKGSDRAMLKALGYQAISTEEIPRLLPELRLIFNTVPHPILSEETLSAARECVCLDLASAPGLLGPKAIRARGLPGIHAPESSGELIASIILKSCQEACL